MKVIRAFLSIESDEQPDSYRSVNLHADCSLFDEHRVFATGDFLEDWQAAINHLDERVIQFGFDGAEIAYSSTVDFWQANSVEYALDETDDTWRRMTLVEQAEATVRLAAMRS